MAVVRTPAPPATNESPAAGLRCAAQSSASLIRCSVKLVCQNLSHEAQFLLGAKRESSLDELHRALQWNFERGCKDGVNVGHDDEFMDLETAALAIVGEHVDQKRGHAVSLEQAANVPRYWWSRRRYGSLVGRDQASPALKRAPLSRIIRRAKALRFHQTRTITRLKCALRYQTRVTGTTRQSIEGFPHGTRSTSSPSRVTFSCLELPRPLPGPAHDHHFLVGVELDGVAALAAVRSGAGLRSGRSPPPRQLCCPACPLPPARRWPGSTPTGLRIPPAPEAS